MRSSDNAQSSTSRCPSREPTSCATQTDAHKQHTLWARSRSLSLPLEPRVQGIDSQSGSATGDEIAAIDEFNDSLRANGHWIFAWGLESPEMSVVIDNRADAGQVSKGPLHNLDEYVAGFWLIEADDFEKARELAAAGSKACNRKVELRKLHG